jgi:hypothetical protein
MSIWKQLFGQKEEDDIITIVSGLPRSGTSMMMRMLEAGGLRPLTDEIRSADNDNPQGYYEFERVKQLDKGDITWLPQAKGKAVKIISALLRHLPPEYDYRVIFMRRSTEEILASQTKMLQRRGEPVGRVSDEELAILYEKHLKQIYDWLETQTNVSVLDVNYNRLVSHPDEELTAVNRFLGGHLDVERMTGVVDARLYRNRQ